MEKMARSCPVESCAKLFSTAEKFRAHVQLHLSGNVQGHIPDHTLTTLGITLCEHCAKPFLNLHTHSPKCPKAPTRGQVGEVHGSRSNVTPSHSPPPSLPPSLSVSASPAPAVTILTANSSQPSQSPNALFSLNHCNLDSISFADIFKMHAPTLRSVPARFIQEYGHLLMNELSNVAQYNHINAYKRLFMFTTCVLPRTGQVSNKHTPIPDHLNIELLLQKWKEPNGPPELFAQAQRRSTQSRSHTDNSNHNNATRAISTLRRGGRLSKSMQQLTSSGLAPNSEEIRLKLLLKIPRADNIPIDIEAEPEDSAPQLEVEDEEIIWEVLKSFDNTVGVDNTGLTPQHFIDASRANLPKSVITTLTDVINLIIKGEAPPELQPYLAGGVLVAFNKSVEGVVGGDIRPIVMGNILRRIAAKVICKVKKDQFNHYLSPHQKGTQKGGSEQIIHSVRAAIERDNLPTNWVLAKIDLKNAFNLVSRKQVLLEVATNFPSIYKWVKYMLGSASYLNWSDEVIESAIGVQQGDPLAPVLFCMVLKKVINVISANCALDINLWFLDDGVIAGPAKEVSRALEIIEQVGPELGLFTNLSKKDGGVFCTDEITLNSFQQFSHRSLSFNFPLLGVPVGDLDYCNQYALDLVEKVIKDTHEPISKIQDPQTATLLLRKCASFCKLVFLTRATPINYITKALLKFDKATLSCFEECVGFSLASEATCRPNSPPKAEV